MQSTCRVRGGDGTILEKARATLWDLTNDEDILLMDGHCLFTLYGQVVNNLNDCCYYYKSNHTDLPDVTPFPASVQGKW